MAKFDPSEFTEEFDLARFKEGEPACYSEDKGFYCLRFFDEGRQGAINSEGNFCSPLHKIKDLYYKMRPAQDDGWIDHDGGECPIPWAAFKDFDLRDSNGEIRLAKNDEKHGAEFQNSSATDCNWRVIAHYRLNGIVIAAVRRVPVVVETPDAKQELQSQIKQVLADHIEAGRQPLTDEQFKAHRAASWIAFWTEHLSKQHETSRVKAKQPFNISDVIDTAFAEARDGKRIPGPVVEVPRDVVLTLMKG